MIALEVLKFYTGLSDVKLVERLNTDWAMRLFCGLSPLAGQWIKDKDLPSHYRTTLASQINYQSFQRELASYWMPYVENKQMVFTNGTCYESYIKYPTDVKLLWQMKHPRSKFNAQQKQQLAYRKQRRKSKKQERKRKKALLYLLDKLLGKLSDLLLLYQVQGQYDELLPEKFYKRVEVIKKIYEQQQFHYHHPEQAIPERIVSLYKPYLRPVVRGKETKQVEFGMKVNIRQVDGLNFIEHISFKSFNEAKHLKEVVWQHRQDFGSCKQVGADQIYATNEKENFVQLIKWLPVLSPKEEQAKMKSKPVS